MKCNIMILKGFNIAAYLLSFACLISFLSEPTLWRKRATLCLLLISISLQAFVLYDSIDIGHVQNLSFSNVIAMIIWEAAVISWLASLRWYALDLFLMIIPCAIFSLLMMFILPGETFVQVGGDPPLFLHVMLSIMAFSLLALAFIQAIYLVIQHYFLRHKRFLMYSKVFPSIEFMDKLLFIFIYLGFFVLSLILLTTVFELPLRVLSVQIQHKVILTIVAWLIFGIIILCRYRYGWQGVKAALGTMVGYMILLLSYFSANILSIPALFQ
jgi:ABC-type uncharacterized transport system permease subunit